MTTATGAVPVTYSPPEQISATTFTVHRSGNFVNGKFIQTREYTDLRGAPKADTVTRWTGERMVSARRGAKRRTREKVTLDYCPEGWHSTSGGENSPSGPEICTTILDANPTWAAGSGWDRHQFRTFHETHPVVWRVQISSTAKFGSGRRRYCDPELPDEFRPLIVRAEDEPRPAERTPRKPKTAPDYFAVPDPLDPPNMSYWYRPADGGDVQPWPPKRGRWGGSVYKSDIPAGIRVGSPEFLDWVRPLQERARAGREAVKRAIDADPAAAAARFAAFATRCAFCGKVLTDQTSKVFGVGPDCRTGAPAELVDAIAEQVRRVHGERQGEVDALLDTDLGRQSAA